MKTWRTISLISSAVALFVTAFIFTTPLRYPDFAFFWQPIVIFLIPLAAIIYMLALRPRWSHSPFSKALFVAALLFAGLTAFGYMGWPVLGLSLFALLGMFIASRALPDMQA